MLNSCSVGGDRAGWVTPGPAAGRGMGARAHAPQRNRPPASISMKTIIIMWVGARYAIRFDIHNCDNTNQTQIRMVSLFS